MSNPSCIIIAITGASASGKSSIASTVHKELCNELGCQEIGIITEDSYYKDQSHLEMTERVKRITIIQALWIAIYLSNI